jgi:2-polyprenyl-6-methoxyphenol hydroxylase-like FAD-dependent oxidoreductase
MVGAADPETEALVAEGRAPDFAARIRAATRVERFHGGADPNFFRRPFGPDWVLVGDAGFCKDPITAQGISDAFRDADECSAALHEVPTGHRPFDEAMTAVQLRRDAHSLPIYEFTTELATLAPPPPEIQQLLGSLYGDQTAMDDFASVIAGTLSPADFFSAAAAAPAAM